MSQRWLVIMVKEPRAGRVKTRLGKDIGMVAAAWWFRHQVQRLIRRLADPRWTIVLAVSPDAAGLQSRFWPAGIARIGQRGGDLGDRMARIFDSMPPGPVVIVGSDIPDIKKPAIARAFRALGNAEAAIGPTPDGGYWLIGLKRLRPRPRAMFKGVAWSTKTARTDTLATLGDARIGFVEELPDVDTAADLAASRANHR